MNRFPSQTLAPLRRARGVRRPRGTREAMRVAPDADLTDVMMPRERRRAHRRDAQRPELATAPILLLTAKADEPLLVRLLATARRTTSSSPSPTRLAGARAQPRARAAGARAGNGLRLAAESANRAKDEFLAMLGHELRNPLAPIVTALELHAAAAAPHGSERERDDDRAPGRPPGPPRRRPARRLAHHARQDRAAQASRSSWPTSSTRAIETAGPLLEQRAHTLDVEVPRRGLIVDGRRGPARAGGREPAHQRGEVHRRRAAHRCRRAGRDGGEVVLSVRDNGIGIAPRVLPHIFDLFVQEPQALDRSQGGLGLGLTIVRSLVELHGGTSRRAATGRARAASSSCACRARRTTSARAADRGDGRPQPHRPSAATMRVLVVDDNEDAAALLCRRCCAARLRRARRARRPDALQRGRGVPPRGRAARHRPAGDGRLRARAPAARAAGAGRHPR